MYRRLGRWLYFWGLRNIRSCRSPVSYKGSQPAACTKEYFRSAAEPQRRAHHVRQRLSGTCRQGQILHKVNVSAARSAIRCMTPSAPAILRILRTYPSLCAAENANAVFIRKGACK